MSRPSNRELKVLSHLGSDKALGPADFKDVGERTFAGMLKKGWIKPADSGVPDTYQATEAGLAEQEEERYYGRWKR